MLLRKPLHIDSFDFYFSLTLKNVTKINDNAGPARHDFISKGFTIRVVYFTYVYDQKFVFMWKGVSLAIEFFLWGQID